MNPPSPALAARDGRVLAMLAAAITLQPLTAAWGIPRSWLGVALLGLAALAARVSAVSVRRVLADAAWMVLPVVAVLAVAGRTLAESIGTLSAPAATGAVFLSAGALTDITAAGIGARLVELRVLPVAAALVAVNAGAILTPVASVAALLLRQQMTLADVEMRRVVWVVPAIAACVAGAAAALIALY